MIYSNDETSFFNGARGGGGLDSGGMWRPQIPGDQSKFNPWMSQNNKNPTWNNTGMRQTPTFQPSDKNGGMLTWSDPIYGADPINGLGQQLNDLMLGGGEHMTGNHQWGQSEINQSTPWDIDAPAFNGGMNQGNKMIDDGLNQWKAPMNNEFMGKNGTIPNGFTGQDKAGNGFYGNGYHDINTSELPPMMNGMNGGWNGARNFAPANQPGMNMHNQQRFPPYGVRPPNMGNPPPINMLGGPPNLNQRPPSMPPMQGYGNGGNFGGMGNFVPQAEPAIEQDPNLFWHDPNGDMRKWQRDTGTALWGDPTKQVNQEIRRWTQAPDPEEEKHVEAVAVALKDENGTPINPSWPELPPLNNGNANVQTGNNNILGQRPPNGGDGWMNQSGNFMSQNQSVWPDQSRPINSMPPNNYAPGQQNLPGAYPHGMNDWSSSGRPPSTMASSIFGGQNGNILGEHMASQNGMKPQNDIPNQKFVESLKMAVKKGLLDMNILYNVTNPTNGQLPQNVIYYIHHILGRVEQLKNLNQKAEMLKLSSIPAQRNDYDRLMLEIHAIKTEISEICEKINGYIAAKQQMPTIPNVPPAYKPVNVGNTMWEMPPPSTESGNDPQSISSSRFIDEIANLPMPGLTPAGIDSIWSN